MSSPDSPPKRPRLSLQIKAISNGPSVRTSRSLAAAVNPRSPTSFNTLSNVYVTAIGKSAPVEEPLTAINTRSRGLPLKLQTQNVSTPITAFGVGPETPLTAQPMSPAVLQNITFPSTMTATPPLSAGPMEATDSKVFTFSAEDTSATRPRTDVASQLMSPRTPKRRTTAPGTGGSRAAPYSHNPRSLPSILRNSPLPRLPTMSPDSPRRQSKRLQEKAARRVCYNTPLTQTITTNKYTKSHIDLLCEEASPFSPSKPPTEDPEIVLDLAMAYTGDETRDGGQTPGPFEEMRRRMAGLAAASPLSSPSGIKKRTSKKREKKRRWVWTIGVEDEEGDDVGGAVAAYRAAEAAAAGTPLNVAAPKIVRDEERESLSAIPKLCINTMAVFNQQQRAYEQPSLHEITPSIESSDFSSQIGGESSASEMDVEMSDVSSVTSDMGESCYGGGLNAQQSDYELVTPTLTRSNKRFCSVSRLGSEDMMSFTAGSRRDTPIPAHLTCS
ncbi:hypothetical protein MCOR29_011145 [Pyricularia oryzae]|nr:hypothetical protein MCOR29_011145 [Pyricularia oryzae]KAI6372313.1 hypothetical protein MCOR31_003704 [Pyricularia oryzae]KAI6416589.1 hypothetical protein MCOR21_011249 [Pyricularia oryzae]KAI6418741.1 hypothetical protein MCOR24_005310 [Pyricularia oryzae]KAI6467441.1 hypothetical protein MCOR15_002574 [Pyricularia oryzae]